MLIRLFLFICFLPVCLSHGHDSISPIRLARSIDSDLVVVVAETTQGPFAESLNDYVNSSNVLTAAKAGSPGVTTDRKSVLDGIPLNLTINVYAVYEDDSIAEELQYADVYIWHCDAAGVYSAVGSTEGQKWLRGVQNTGKKGRVTFQTIVPGWYPGRILHYHIRVHLLGQNENTFEIATQFFFSQELTDTIKVLSPYVDNKQSLITHSRDGVWNSLPVDAREELVLSLSGSPTSGYTSTFNMGIEGIQNPGTSTTTSTSTSTTSTASTGKPLMECDQCEANCQKCCKAAESKDATNKCKRDCRALFCEPYFC